MHHYFLAYDPLPPGLLPPIALGPTLHKSCDDLAEIFTWLVDCAIDHHFTVMVTEGQRESIVRFYLVLAHEADTVALRLRWGGASPKTLDDPTFFKTPMWLA